ncbi:6-phosphogluconolactonase [Hymenobacter sp. BT491]|uniref:6-phosphogluconolactonase n=1 Tax=Hymenobacter sp. BT491 TaxID=2766779 RepID=UPI0016539D88|nr:6-phosphogluconolactonase [Hymenobacter sp. BT491]MBC6990814.1 6-phosphogluconolactonase [Hymenobacter sp. BT491]
MKLTIFATVEALLQGFAEYFVATANQAIAERGQFSVALSGGNSPKKLFELLASDAFRAQVAWEKVYFFFGDERYVPHTSPDSNYLMAKKALLDPLNIDSSHIFPVDTSVPPVQAAQRYEATIDQFFRGQPARFDLLLMGLGDNAHTASLFPHTPVLHEEAAGIREVYLEDKKVYRITMTAPLINQGRNVAFLVYGADKAAALRRVLEEARNIEEYPAQLIAPTDGDLHWFVDQAIASELKNSYNT